MPSYVAGLDLGQAADPSALVIIEKRQDLGYDPASVRTVTERPLQRHWSGRGEAVTRREVLMADGSLRDLADVPAPTLLSYDLRHAARFPLGTSYPAIVAEVCGMLPTLGNDATLVIDSTGVGRAVTDMFMQYPGRNFPIVAVIITAGTTVTRDEETGYWHVPKRDLVGVVQVALQQKRLRFPDPKKLPTVDVLTHELSNFRVTISAAGNDSYAAWRERDHDDLVLALALSLWEAERGGGMGVWHV